MDRYKVFQAWENIDTDPNGEWVKYSDVEALQARVRELEEGLDEIRLCLDPDDWMGEQTFFDFIDSLKGTP